MKTPTSNLAASLWSRPRPLIARISFETRSTAVVNAASTDMCTNGLLFVSKGRSDLVQDRVSDVATSHPTLKQVEILTSDPLVAAETITEAVTTADLSDAIIDVTSFRREEVLVLLQALRSMEPKRRKNCELVYVSAGKMADTLSGKVTQCRSVVGYAGEIWPSRPTRLVILMGFETPRARAIIETYEPKHLILGHGRKSESISDDLFNRNVKFFRELESNYNNVESKFEFSARDPLAVVTEIGQAVSSSEPSNVVLAPLHTKLSTIGVGLYAQEQRNVQVCYAEVGAYNEENYSTVGTDTYILSLSTLFGEV